MNDVNDLGVWPVIWYWVLILGGTTFLATLAYSIIVGFKDIQELFTALARSDAQHDAATDPSDAQRSDPLDDRKP